jgi:hypothetical protein
MRGGLLVPEVDDADPLILASVVDGGDVAAGQREEVGNPFLLQDGGDQVPAVPRLVHPLRLLLGLLAHPTSAAGHGPAALLASGRRRS